MENTFLEKKLTDNANQDPMGNDAHQGLERFLDKFHQPGVPSHTIITDPEYFVFLWFHNANGQLIQCPYVSSDYVTKMSQTSVNFATANSKFYDRVGIQSGTEDTMLPDYCFDLTPFVREATLPDIQPAGGEKITTLFGETTAGSFSPYASDGQKSITLQVLDTEYSILDAIFYPWMKDINSPWWYKPDAAFTEWATPYPMATLEIQRPRMRYMENAMAKDSRNEGIYKYYSYKFLGVKPTNYSAFNVNSGGPSSLLRNLSLTADMCLVDLTSDAAGADENSTNLGNRSKLLFADSSSGSGDESQDSDNGADFDKDMLDQEIEKMRNELDGVSEEQSRNEEGIEQQEEGDLPGEDESEMEDPDSDDYNDDEYTDEFDDDNYDDPDDAEGGQDPDEPIDEDSEFEDDEVEPWDIDEGEELDGEDRVNEMADDTQNNNAAQTEPSKTSEKEAGFVQNVVDGLMDVGSGVMKAAGSAAGWVANAADAGLGLAADVAGKAVGVATDVASGALGAAASIGKSALGAAGDLAATALGAVGGLAGTATNAAGKILGGVGTAAQTAIGATGDLAKGILGPLSGQQQNSGPSQQSGGLFSSLGNALGNALGTAGNTAFGVVQGVASAAGIGSGGQPSPTTSLLGGVLNKGLSSAFSLASNMVGQAGNVLSGAVSNLASAGSSQKNMAGAISQNIQATDQVRQTGLLTSALNAASSTISGTMNLAGGIASSVLNVAGNAASSTMNSIGGIMKRMTTAKGNTPTPVESYVAMVTKQNTKGQTSA